jgi:hypothetical protein
LISISNTQAFVVQAKIPATNAPASQYRPPPASTIRLIPPTSTARQGTNIVSNG